MGILSRIKETFSRKSEDVKVAERKPEYVKVVKENANVKGYGEIVGLSQQRYVPETYKRNLREKWAIARRNVEEKRRIQNKEREFIERERALEKAKSRQEWRQSSEGRLAQKYLPKIRRQLTGYETKMVRDKSGRMRAKIVPTQARLKQYGGSGVPTPQKMLIMQRIAQVGGTRVPYQGIYYQGKTGKIGRGRPKGSYEGKYAAYGGVFGYRKFMAKQRTMQALRQQQMMQNIRQKNPQYAYAIETGQAPMPQVQQQAPQIQQQMVQQQQMPQQPIQTPAQDFNAFKVPNPFASNQPLPQPTNPFMTNNLNFPTEKPVTNAQGDWYTESDGFTGRQVLRRRNQDNMFQW